MIEGEYVSTDTMHLKDHLVLFGTIGSALTHIFLLSSRIMMLSHCSSTTKENHFLVISYDTKSSCADAPLKPHSFTHIHMYIHTYMHSYVHKYVHTYRGVQPQISSSAILQDH